MLDHEKSIEICECDWEPEGKNRVDLIFNLTICIAHTAP